jgi:hypothetical protein
METLGPTMEKYLVQVIFKIILVLYIIYIAIKLVAAILVENISGVSAHQKANLEKLNRSQTGKNITVHAQNSKRI